MSALTRWLSQAATAGTGAVHWLALGDSVTEGSKSTHLTNRYVNKLLTQLQTHYGVTGGGVGFVNVFSNNTANVTDYWTYSGAGSGTNSSGFLGNRARNFAADETATFVFTGTLVTLHYLEGTAGTFPFTVTVDGGAPQTVTPRTSAPLNQQGVWSTGTLSAGSHTLVVTPQSTKQLFLRGATVYNGDTASGVHLWEGAQFGNTSTNFLAGAGSTAALTDPLAEFLPSLVTIFLGLNDYQNGIAPSTYQSNLQSIIANVKGLCATTPSFLLITPYARTDVTSPAFPLSQYVTACNNVATADSSNVAVFDLSAVFNPASVPTQMDADGVHPNDAGHNAIANFLYPTLSAAYVPQSRWAKRWTGSVWVNVPVRRTA